MLTMMTTVMIFVIKIVYLYIMLSLYCYNIVQMVQGGGQVEVRLVKYDNPNGLTANGRCCDPGRGRRCDGECDHEFIVCLDNRNG